jgi:uncharacterized small protein (DUF1192 family)
MDDGILVTAAALIDLGRHTVNDSVMDLEDLFPSKPDDPLVALAKQDLDPLSIDELNERIELLKAEIARVEAIAAWAGQLRDMLSGGSGLLETIEATAPFAPAPIRAEVERLALSMRRGRLHAALRAFAADVDDPMADLVVASLIVATTEQVGRLGELLGMLATRTREQAALRMRIDKDRANVRTQVRGVVLFTVAMMTGLTVWSPGLLAAYDSAEGQLVLAGVGAAFLGGFAMLARISRPQRMEGFTLAAVEERP